MVNQRLQRHPLSAAFPDMPADEFHVLVEDIKEIGQREKGWLYEGKILDGWHRYRACIEAGVQFRANEYSGQDPARFVVTKNACRRHLTASQRAVAVATCAKWALSGANQHTQKGGGAPGAPPPQSVEEAAKSAGVSETTMHQAKAAVEAGHGDAVRAGKMSVKAAAAAAKPKKAKKPKPAVPLDPKGARIAKLEKENAELRQKNEVLTQELEQLREAESFVRAETSLQLLDTEPAKLVLQYKAEIKRVERYRDDLLNQNGHMVKQIKMLERKLSRYEGGRKAA